MNEMCNQRVAPRDDRGVQPEFFRKRKRGYYRANKRGVKDMTVVSFVHEQFHKKMMSSVVDAYYRSFVDDLKEPLGLLHVIKEENVSS